MEDKNEREKLMEELKRINREKFEKFYETICESFDDFLKRKSLVKDDWEMKCPYKVGDEYWFIFDNGHIDIDCWEGHATDFDRFKTGNAYPTEETALLEAKRRNLLTRFRAFRDECNNGWKPDWSNHDKKWEISHDADEEEFKVFWCYATNSFSTFGYFKNEQDAERAIELFGDEIEELFVECDA